MHACTNYLSLLQGREEAVGQVGEVLQAQGLEGRAAARQHLQAGALQGAVVRNLQVLVMGEQQR